MPEKWTEIDGEKDGEGEEMGIAGIPARTGHTQETGNKEEGTGDRKQGTKNPPLYERTGDN